MEKNSNLLKKRRNSLFKINLGLIKRIRKRYLNTQGTNLKKKKWKQSTFLLSSKSKFCYNHCGLENACFTREKRSSFFFSKIFLLFFQFGIEVRTFFSAFYP
jgi:hypothetical protein